MYRRVVSLLLLPWLLLTQSVSMGHWHEEGQPPGHGQRPHFHASSASLCHGDGHHHLHHYHDDELPPVGLDKLPPLSDHDSDAIYIDAADALVVERSEITEEISSPTWWVVSPTLLSGVCESSPVASVDSQARPPDGSGCPLYIRHLALLL